MLVFCCVLFCRAVPCRSASSSSKQGSKKKSGGGGFMSYFKKKPHEVEDKKPVPESAAAPYRPNTRGA